MVMALQGRAESPVRRALSGDTLPSAHIQKVVDTASDAAPWLCTDPATSAAKALVNMADATVPTEGVNTFERSGVLPLYTLANEAANKAAQANREDESKSARSRCGTIDNEPKAKVPAEAQQPSSGQISSVHNRPFALEAVEFTAAVNSQGQSPETRKLLVKE